MPDSFTPNIEINNSDRVLRRISYLDPNFIKEDGTPASSSFTLKKHSDGTIEDGLSVDIERLTTHEKSIVDITLYRLFALKVEFIRGIDLDCEHNPQINNPAHTLIIGNITKSVSRKLAQNTHRIPYPD